MKIFCNQTECVSITEQNFHLDVAGDVTIKIYNNNMLSIKKLGRVAFNTAFLKPGETLLKFQLSEIDPDNLVYNKKIPKNFEIHVKFASYCECLNTNSSQALCGNCKDVLVEQLNDWKEINSIVEVSNNYDLIRITITQLQMKLKCSYLEHLTMMMWSRC